jgi:hypothetical protein
MQFIRHIPFSIRVENKLIFRLKMLLRLITLLIGGIHTWAAVISYSMNEDGINYLDIGDAYFRGDWAAAISSVWSPMYSWILGTVMWIVNPTMRWEFPLVHFVNFMIYVGALICFEFFWRQVMNYHRGCVENTPENSIMQLPDWTLLTLGYLIFMIASLHLIEIWAVTPDMLMSAFVYLAAGIVVRIRMGFVSLIQFVLLGLVLGLGFLAKAIMFPLAFFFLGVCILSENNIRRPLRLILVGGAVFLLLSSPFIAVVSYAKGELTLSSAGKLTYAKHVNNVTYPHWQGGASGSGTPVHPSKKIFDLPPIYEFGEPIGGTYPISHDPSYWYEGIAVNLNFKNQFNYFITSTLFYFDLFFRQLGGLMFGVFILYFLSRQQSLRFRDLILNWGLVIPAFAAFGFYALVNVAGRYIGVFVVLFTAELLANVRIRDSQLTRRLVPFLGIIMIVFLLINIAVFNLEGFRALAATPEDNSTNAARDRSPSWPGEVAEELHRLGIKPKDSVAVIGYAFHSYWARLARVKIVAEMLGWEADPFWLGSPSFQSEVIEVFRRTKARAIVAEEVPGYARLRNWQQINDTNYYIYFL